MRRSILPVVGLALAALLPLSAAGAAPTPDSAPTSAPCSAPASGPTAGCPHHEGGAHACCAKPGETCAHGAACAAHKPACHSKAAGAAPASAPTAGCPHHAGGADACCAKPGGTCAHGAACAAHKPACPSKAAGAACPHQAGEGHPCCAMQGESCEHAQACAEHRRTCAHGAAPGAAECAWLSTRHPVTDPPARVLDVGLSPVYWGGAKSWWWLEGVVYRDEGLGTRVEVHMADPGAPAPLSGPADASAP